MSMDEAVRAEALVKTFGRTRALGGLDSGQCESCASSTPLASSVSSQGAETDDLWRINPQCQASPVRVPQLSANV